VTIKTALHHPNLEASLVFLGGCEIAPLLKHLSGGLTPVQVARSWSSRIPLQSGLVLVSWLMRRGVLVQEGLSIRDASVLHKPAERAATS
jgi:hypothetical protein